MQRGHDARNNMILSADFFAQVRFEMAKMVQSLG